MRALTAWLVLSAFALGCGDASDTSPEPAAGAGGVPGSPDSGGSLATGGTSKMGGSPNVGGSSTVGKQDAAAGGSSASGGSSGSGGSGTGGAGDAGVSEKCTSPVGPGLPAGAPQLPVGIWVDISPAGWPFSTQAYFTQGIAIDSCNPAVLYLTASSFDASTGGLFKSTDAGGHWRKVAKTSSGYIDEPIRVRVDPNDTQHLYVADGVRGGSEGFWVSTDGGESFVPPQSFQDLGTQQKMFQYDAYDLAVDPTDFKHLLLSFHGAWGWTDTKWNTNSGVLESKDGGATWIVHEPMSGWGTGHSINFLYRPELGIGDSRTWLLGTQGPGMFRTTDAGQTWTQITDQPIQHGGGTIYYAKTGVVYATSANSLLRSTDNGASWTKVGPSGGYNGIGGDGTRLYALKGFYTGPYTTSLETDGLTWTDYNSQSLQGGSFELAYDAINGIVYSGNWNAGLWALRPR